MMPMITRDAMQARDLRPQDTEPDVRMTNMIRAAAGRGPLVMTADPDGPDDTGQDDADGPDDAPTYEQSMADAQTFLDNGQPRDAVALILQSADADVRAVASAIAILKTLGAEPLVGPGHPSDYAPIAMILGLSPLPDPSVRDAAALSLLLLDGPGDAQDAGLLMRAEGDALNALVNRVRARAGYPAITWAMSDDRPLWPR